MAKAVAVSKVIYCVDTHLLEDILILELFFIHQISTIVHTSGIGEKWHALGKTKYQATNVGLAFGLHV